MNLKELTGTNYYAKVERKSGYDLVHLGKTCYKLRFAFRWNPEHYIDFNGFDKFVNRHSIINHFGRPVNPEFLIKTIIREKYKEASIADAYQKAGKGDLVHIVKEIYENVLYEHHFIDEDLGVEQW